MTPKLALPGRGIAGKSAPVMLGITFRATVISLFALAGASAWAQDVEEKVEVVVSVAEQKLLVLRDGMWTHRFPVSTSKFGLGDAYGSYKTPLGKLRVCQKIGAGLPPGSVMQHRNPTGEILPVNARGRDPIVTRIMWLEGLEPGNDNARGRGIYIHGTVEESKIGKPVSYGCIRMKSRDVLDLFEAVPMGSIVSIQQEKLPKAKRWSPPPPAPAPPAFVAAKEPVRQKEPVVMGQKNTEKLTAKAEPLPAKQKELPAVAQRTTERVTLRSEPVIVKPKEPVIVANHKPARVEAEPMRAPSAATRLVIRASGTEDHDVRPSPLAADAFKGSILFSDLPERGSQGRN